MHRQNRESATRSHQVKSFVELERGLLSTYGAMAMAGGRALTQLLGYKTQDAFRQAHQRGRLPIRTFEVEGRQGRFAAVPDIARWLWARLATAELPHTAKPDHSAHRTSNRGASGNHP